MKTDVCSQSGKSRRSYHRTTPDKFFDSNESSVTKRELEHIYTIDSMTQDDFLKYNLSELLNLAKRGTKAQKNWLKEFLERCETCAEKQRLLAALTN
jgi:hypothetical protein